MRYASLEYTCRDPLQYERVSISRFHPQSLANLSRSASSVLTATISIYIYYGSRNSHSSRMCISLFAGQNIIMSYRCHRSTPLLLLLPLIIWLEAIGCARGSSKVPLPINMVQSNSSETTSVLVDDQQPENATMRCDDARLRCAYRTGCGRALQHYLTLCASVLQGGVNDCPEICQHALIGLMSTDEGKDLMTVSED